MRTGLKSNDTRFLLRPDSDFFKFFGNPSGKPPAAPTQPEAAARRSRTARGLASRSNDVLGSDRTPFCVRTRSPL